MLKAFFARLLIAVACLACLAGCGEGDSETRGNINLPIPTVRALSPGLYLIQGQASYSEAVPGFPITITATFRTPDGVLIDETSEELSTDSSGVVVYGFEVEQGTVNTIVTITASSGGLAEREWVTIPAAAPI